MIIEYEKPLQTLILDDVSVDIARGSMLSRYSDRKLVCCIYVGERRKYEG
jgi:hypothetical protein